MTLIVHAPSSYPAERRYVLDVVLADWLGLAWRLETHERPEVRVTLAGDGERTELTMPDLLFGTDPSRWLSVGSLPAAPVPRIRVGDVGSEIFSPDERLPAIYRGDPEPPRLVEVERGRVRLQVDVFGSVFFMLSRYEEVVRTDGRDRYDRFPASCSLAAEQGFLDQPVVDAYVELLAASLTRLWPRLPRRRGRYRVLLTHDVDDPLSTLGRTGAQLARQLAGDVIKRRDPGLAVRRARSLAAARRGNHDPDPHNTFDFLMDTSERHGLRSAFYFLARNDADPNASAYQLFDHPWVEGLLGRVHQRGHEVGLHAGFGTYRDPERLADEFARLRALAARRGVEQEAWGGRQHYLQWSNPWTWRYWNEVGLRYDCTVGYSEAVGFRTGTCHEYRVFDLVERRPLDLVEKPFQVMDVTLFGYLSLTPEQARASVMAVAGECRRFGGTLGILWHNDEVLRTARDKRWYASLVESLANPTA
jgi:hypothetical protein